MKGVPKCWGLCWGSALTYNYPKLQLRFGQAWKWYPIRIVKVKDCSKRTDQHSEWFFGEVAEWSNVPDSKSGVPQGTGGSNPSLSAIRLRQLSFSCVVEGIDFVGYIPKGNIRGINQLEFFDRTFFVSHWLEATSKFVDRIFFTIIHNLDFIL